ncbi:terpenoid synthase [Chiua virens]|nr:terpenoid synthase [Chiua virens]
MENSARLLLFSVFNGLLIHLAFSGISDLIVRKRKVGVDASVLREESSVEKKDTRPTRAFIPDVLARWPWPRQINPNYAVLKKQTDAWVASFQAFSPKAQHAYDHCDFKHARIGCHLMHVVFLFDEYSDRSTPIEVRKQKDVVMDALRNPHTPRPKGEWLGGEFVRQFWDLAVQNATAVAQKRFIHAADEYLESVVQESIDKKERRILDIESYVTARRRTSGVKISFSICELGLDIPDEVMSHPAIQEMILAATDIIAFCNDIYSYNMEQLRGDDGHNIITIVMHEHRTDVNGAMLWVEDLLFGAQERFHAAKAALPEWDEPLNSQVQEYCDGLGQWVRAVDEWSFESERYFGKKGSEIKKNRWMLLLPKGDAKEIGPVHIESSLL